MRCLKHIVLLFSVITLCSFTNLFAMGGGGSFEYKGIIKPGTWLRKQVVEYSSEGSLKKVSVQLYFPQKYKQGDKFRTLILLHEYRGNIRDWERETVIERLADRYNIVLVCPAMKNTLYEGKFYPETKAKWGNMPGGLFIGDVLIPYLRNRFKLATNRDATAIMGVAVGARGALLTSARYTGMIGAVVGLSGLYDSQTSIRSGMLTSVYGPYKKFKARWKKDDNMMNLAVELDSTPVFLWHGAKDFRISRNNTLLLAMRLKTLQKKSGGYEIVFREAKHHHDGWKYWRRVLPEAMSFLDKKMDKMD